MQDESQFEVGDLVTRDGSDVQRVLRADDGFGSITVKCIVAPESGWCSIGETEQNLSRRYTRVDLRDVTPANITSVMSAADERGDTGR